jgi:TolB-like protein
MKRLWVVAVLAMLCACASSGQSSSGPLDLDTAIQQAAKEINNALPAANKVALLNFSSESDVFSEYVLEEMSIELVKARKLVVVDRKELDLIRGEMNFQMSGEVSDESAQKIGEKLGAQTIVSGSLINMGKSYRFRTKAINVISAKIETSSSLNVKSDEQIQYLLSQGRKATTPQTATTQGSTPATPAQAQPAAPTQPATPAARAYKVGDTGPAGGLIFYDKGRNSSGWRYLEAAPVEAEFRAIWSVHGNQVNTALEKTRNDVGYGKRNTQFLTETFRQTAGEWDTAAQKVDDLVFKGFDDWFLPSKDELDQMYGNLKRRNLGDFKDEWYWSSTEWNVNIWGDAAYVQNFKDGQIDGRKKNANRLYVRPIRQVAGPEGNARSSVDGGPVGGIGDSGSGGTAAVSKGKVGFFDVLIVVGGIGLLGLIGYGIYKGITNPEDESARAAMAWR